MKTSLSQVLACVLALTSFSLIGCSSNDAGNPTGASGGSQGGAVTASGGVGSGGAGGATTSSGGATSNGGTLASGGQAQGGSISQGGAASGGKTASGGTTGAPKRVVMLRDWLDRSVAWGCQHLNTYGVDRGLTWLGIVPSGPHSIGELFRQPDAFLGFFFAGATMGQLLCIPMVLAGIWLIVRARPA